RLRRFREAIAMDEQVIAVHRQLVARAGNAPGALRSMHAALRTQGGVHYNAGDYVRACAIWREALGILTDLERRGALTAFDRNRGVPETRNYLRRACEGGPPRAGLGPSI